MKSCIIIGISDNHNQWFTPEVNAIIQGGKIFSGGKRHHEIMQQKLPPDAEWIEIAIPLSDVFLRYKYYEEVVIFASGDPLFFGFATTVMKACPDCKVNIYPSFNSLQMMAHRMNLPYHDLHAVSLTGRSWDALDEALIRGEKMIGCLTDKNKTPNEIWKRMQTYGYDNYQMIVGERLSNMTEEQISDYEEGRIYNHPNCLLLMRQKERPFHFGISEKEFHLLSGRQKMITKMPIRLCSIATLDLGNRRSMWDIGFCTGSVSIEARLRWPHLHITAFEIRPEGEKLMQMNCQKFGAPGIVTVIGDFLKLNLNEFEAPDAVFIGGHGGHLREMIAKIHRVLADGGCIVFNSVNKESQQQFEEGTRAVGMNCQTISSITVDENNPITILKAL